MEQLVSLVEKLCDIPGVSGWEGPVRDEILALIKPHCQVQVDSMGNIIAFKKGRQTPKQKLLLSAHMDEVGFIITHIEDSGMLRFGSVGGIDSRVVVGKAVEVGKDRLYGVVGSKAVHLQEEGERSEPPKLENLLIDVGATDRESAERLVRPGDRAIFHAPFLSLGGDKIMGRALDDRAGCALLVALVGEELPYDTHFAFTVQEETGCAGGQCAGYTVDPDISIVVETTTASDIPGVTPDKVVCRLGQGPVLSFMDRGTIYDWDLYSVALAVAGEEGIPCQSKEGVFGGNESRAIQTSRNGAKMLAVSLPCRYLHSPSCVVQVEDIHSTHALLKALIARVDSL